MKYFVLYIFLLLRLTCIAQEDYYQLSKDGEKFKKPLYYLSQNDFSTIKELSDGKIVFLSQKNRFLFNPNEHEIYKINKVKLNNIKTVAPESLYKFEEKEFREKVNKIKKEKGFKPVPPIKHGILKVLILRKINGCSFLYEVDWL